MLSSKEKMDIIRKLDAKCFDYTTLTKYMTHISEPGLTVPLLRSICIRLVQLDSQISAAYEFFTQQEWDQLCSASTEEDTAEGSLHEHRDVVQKIRLFCECYPAFLKALQDQPAECTLRILAPLFRNKTRNIQFVLFHLAKSAPRVAFGFLMNKVRKDSRTYAPFYCSLIARLDMDASLRTRCISVYFDHLSKLQMSNCPDFLVPAQFFLYILCFHRETFSMKGVRAWLDKLFSTTIPGGMNRHVVEQFGVIVEPLVSRTFTPDSTDNSLDECHRKNTDAVSNNILYSTSYHCKAIKSVQCDSLYYFPFDRPICTAIDRLIEKYVDFKN